MRSEATSPKVSRSTQVGCSSLPEKTQRDGSLHKLPQKGFQSESLSKALQDGVGEIL